jgi:molecular chaperone DnaK
MGVRCGIDLGTTYSAISWYDAYNNRVDTIDLESADGAKIIRSVVYYQQGGPPVVGETAWNAARQSPERVIVGIKRSMGTGYKTPPIDGSEYTPPQVSAEILRTVAADAQKYTGEEVKDVVVTVPAYFGDNERAATLEAGKLACLNVLELLSEPQAAALAFAVDKVADIIGKYLLVYDLGGGTFDVTLIHPTLDKDAKNALSLKVDTLCKDGNASLGGLDWDRALAEIVAGKAMSAFGVDVRQDAKNEAILLDNCEKAKRHLSRGVGSVSIVADSANHQVDVTVAEFEDSTRDLLLQTQMLLEKVIEDAGKPPHNIPKDQIQVLLTGGSSKMPMVKKMIEGVTGRPPLTHKNPELLVTIGAAYWAHLLQEGAQVPVPVPQPGGGTVVTPVGAGIVEISSHAVGVEVLRSDGKGGWARFCTAIVPNGADFDKDYKREFRTAEDGMTEIPIVLYKHEKGDTDDLSQWQPLMNFTISGLPPGRAAGQLVEVTLRYDRSGVLRGTAVDVATRKACDILVDRSKPQAA